MKDEKMKQTRDELIVGYYGLVDVIVDKLLIHRFYRDCKPLRDDLMGEGYIGLISAIDTYKNNRGAKLVTYISLKVRGHVIDYIRKHRKKIKAIPLIEESLSTEDLLVYEEDYDEALAYEMYDKYTPDEEIASAIYHRCINGTATCRDIAEEFGTTTNSIKLRKKRLVNKLKKQIQEEEHLYES